MICLLLYKMDERDLMLFETKRLIHRTVARKFSIGGLGVSAGGLWICAVGLDILKIDKTELIYSVSCFNLGVLELFLRGLSPQKLISLFKCVKHVKFNKTVRSVKLKRFNGYH